MDGKVSQFVAITGASSDVARRLLEACGGNLDLAVNMHLESGGSAGSSNEMETANNVLSPKSYEEMYGDMCVYMYVNDLHTRNYIPIEIVGVPLVGTSELIGINGGRFLYLWWNMCIVVIP